MITFHTKRLKAGDDLKVEDASLVRDNSISAGVIASAVGSLSHFNARLAGALPDSQPAITKEGSFEIISLMGTVGTGGMHLHISVSDVDGNVFGGHLKDGCIAKTTVELVILEDDLLIFKREMDDETGFEELVVERAN